MYFYDMKGDKIYITYFINSRAIFVYFIVPLRVRVYILSIFHRIFFLLFIVETRNVNSVS